MVTRPGETPRHFLDATKEEGPAESQTRRTLSLEASKILAGPEGLNQRLYFGPPDEVAQTRTIPLNIYDSVDASVLMRPGSLNRPDRFDGSKSPRELVAAGVITDKTSAGDRVSEVERRRDKAAPRITVELEDKSNPASQQPDFVIKRNGEVVMMRDPEGTNGKRISVVLERPDGQLNPTRAQREAADNLVKYLAERTRGRLPEAKRRLELNDVDDVVSGSIERSERLAPPSAYSGLSRHTMRSVQQLNRLRGSNGVDMPMSATRNMGSFRTRGVPRQEGETDWQAAEKEVVAGLFKPDSRSPYGTIRRGEDGGYRVGRYGFSGQQLNSFIKTIGDPPDAAAVEKLVKEGKLSKAFAEQLSNPEFFQGFKDFANKLESGKGEITGKDVQKYLPSQAQEGIASLLVEQTKEKLGNKPGAIAAAMTLGRAPDGVRHADLSSPRGRMLTEAGDRLFQLAETKQRLERGRDRVGGDRVVGQAPIGNRRDLITQALRYAGVQPTDANIAAVNTIVTKESSWNPNAINRWDSNARRGQPSQGLMQTIPSTFRAHAHPDLPKEITNPLSNLVAGIRYAVHRYGSLQNVPGIRNLARGGRYVGY